jgi:energy-coupling factor transport system substrate-specific component
MGNPGNGIASRVWKGWSYPSYLQTGLLEMKRMIRRLRYSTKDLILIAILAAVGLAVKPLIKPLMHFVTTPLGIPGGTLAGGFYMMWLTLAMAMTKRFGAATLTGLLQGFIVLISGWFGSHGALSIFTYAFPGLVIDVFGLLYKRYDKLDGQMLYCLLANLTGTWLVGLMIMRLPKAPFALALILSVISGIIGGALAFLIYKDLHKHKLV